MERINSGLSILWLRSLLTIISTIIAMQEGTIARLTDRGFGFIARKDEEKDIFFHSNELKNVEFNDLKEGDSVTFEVAEGPKGLYATNINRA